MNGTSSIITQLQLMLQFTKRDLYLYRHRVKNYLINYAIIYPCWHAFAFGYLQGNLYFSSAQSIKGTTLIAGNFLLVIILLTFKLSIDLLFDLENERCIEYQMLILRPPLILIQKMIFAALFAALILLPYYPCAKLLLGNFFVTDHLSFTAFFGMLLASTLMASSYNHLIAVGLKSSDNLGKIWRRLNVPLFNLGGFLIPWYAMSKWSPLLGRLVLCNPLLYVTEGFRSAILGSEAFIPVHLCIGALITASCIFGAATIILFKRRMDHI